jgi:hypothetical protein
MGSRKLEPKQSRGFRPITLHDASMDTHVAVKLTKVKMRQPWRACGVTPA